MDETISTQLNSKTDINCNAENFYKNQWKSGEKIKSERDELSNSILKKFFPNDISKNKVLEIGIGGEWGIVNTLKSTNEVYGVDISDSAINLCKKLNLDVIKANLDSDIIPFSDNYFDIILVAIYYLLVYNSYKLNLKNRHNKVRTYLYFVQRQQP